MAPTVTTSEAEKLTDLCVTLSVATLPNSTGDGLANTPLKVTVLSVLKVALSVGVGQTPDREVMTL